MINVQQVADAAGLSPATVRHHHKLATKARREGVATERHLPAPVGTEDGANLWDDSEIADWISAREKPAKRGAIPKDEMRAVLVAAEAGNIDLVITIARMNI